MNFDELEKALEDIDKYVRYEELINYIVEKRKKDQSYNDLIKTKIKAIVDEYCKDKKRKADLISSKEILESNREYKNAAKLKSLANNDGFMNEVVKLYISKIPKKKYSGDLSTKCKEDLFGVLFESKPILESFDDKYIGDSDILERVWKYLNTEVLVDASSAVAMDERKELGHSCSQLYNALNIPEEEFNVLGYELLKKFYEEEMNRLSAASENNNADDIKKLDINSTCLKKLLSTENICNKDASVIDASVIFNIIKDKLLDSRSRINYIVNSEEYDINSIKNNVYLTTNIDIIKKEIENVFKEKSVQMLNLTNNHSEINKAEKLSLVKKYVLFSQSVYVMYILQLIEKKPKSILNFTDNKKLEEYIVNKLVDMNILKEAYNEVLSKHLADKLDYTPLKQIPDYCFTPTSGKDLLQYLMYIPTNDSINSLTYDENQKILVDAIFKIIYYKMAEKYTEDRIESVRKAYIELLQRNMNDLGKYHNLSGFGDYRYRYYCSRKRKEIGDQIERIKSKDTSGFVSIILGKYIYDIYENSNEIKELGRVINQIKITFMELCKEVLSDISFDNNKFVVDKNGVTTYNIDVIKNALDEIVNKGGYGPYLEKVKETVALQYDIKYYKFACEIENIKFCIWNKINADFSAELLEKMSKVKRKIVESKISIAGLDDLVNKDDYEAINEILIKDLKSKRNRKFVSKKKIEKECEIQRDVQLIIAALKLQKDYNDKFSSEKYDEIAKDKNYSRLCDDIEKMFKDEEFKKRIEVIDFCLNNPNECKFKSVDYAIIIFAKEIEKKLNALSNEKSSSPRKISDIEMNKFKELCDKLGKSIEETIRLLSNENNFVMLLGLVAKYDDTLIEMKEGIITPEQVFKINPEASYNLKKNLLTDLTTLLAEETQKYPQSIETSLNTTDESPADDDLGPKLSYRLR